MPPDDYLAGAVFFVATTGSALLAAGVIVRRWWPGLGGAARVLAFGVLANAIVILVHLAPGLIGVLSRGSAAACALMVLGLSAVLAHRGGRRTEASPRGGRFSSASALIAAAACAAVACGSLAAAWVGTRVSSTDIDTLTFHLPNVARWLQTGSVWRVDQFVPLLANGNYPHNGDLAMLSTVLPWSSDGFVRALGLPFAAISGLSVYALAVEAGARRTAAALLGAVFLALPVYLLAAYEGAKTDAPMLAMFGAGTYFLVRSLRDRAPSSLILGGLALGLAFGTKWYGVWSVAVVVVVWLTLALAARRPPRWVAKAGAGVAGLVALAGGVWMVRNAILSGSPVYPSPVRFAGLTLFGVPRDIPRECGGSTLIGYAGDLDVWRRFVWPAFRVGYGAPGLVLGLGWLLAAGTAAMEFRRAPRERLLVPLALVVCAPLLAAAYASTPYSALGPPGEPFVNFNLRWLLPGLLLAAPACAWALSRLPRWPRLAFETVALMSVVQGLVSGLDLPLRTVLLAGLAGLALAGTVALAATLSRSEAPSRRVVAGGIAVVLGLLSLAVGGRRLDAFHDARFRTGDPVIERLAAGSAHDRRVGLAGVWTTDGLSPVLPAFGPRLGVHTEFVGEMRGGQLREYPTRTSFLAAVREGGYDVLVVGRGTAAYGGCKVPGSETDEDAWARGAGFPLVAQTPRLSLYSVPGRPRSR